MALESLHVCVGDPFLGTAALMDPLSCRGSVLVTAILRWIGWKSLMYCSGSLAASSGMEQSKPGALNPLDCLAIREPKIERAHDIVQARNIVYCCWANRRATLE